MIQPKLVQNNSNEKSPKHVSENSISRPEKNQKIIELEENTNIPGSNNNNWQESNTKRMLRYRFEIGTNLNQETQYQISQAI